MGARQKLNVAVLNGCLIVATVIGMMFQSWTAFFIAVAVLIGASIYKSEIRFSGRKKR